MIPRPLNLEQLVRCLERRFGPVELFPDEGYTKLRVGGLALTFLDAEKLWYVHGKRNVDPSEPGGEADYFYPPLRHDPTIAELEAYFKSLGWRPSALPIGVMRDDSEPPLSPCIRCGTCGGGERSAH